MKSFLMKDNPGDKETFYVHTLCFYMKDIIKNTYELHQLGPGVWSMEGFEAKNSQSKRAIRTHSNRKGNLPAQSMCNLYLQFESSIHDVSAALKQREKMAKTKTRKTTSTSIATISSVVRNLPINDTLTAV